MCKGDLLSPSVHTPTLLCPPSSFLAYGSLSAPASLDQAIRTDTPESRPNGGRVDHVEPMFGIFSTHLRIHWYRRRLGLHASDQDYQPYYCTLTSLNDTSEMNGNCAHAGRAGKMRCTSF